MNSQNKTFKLFNEPASYQLSIHINNLVEHFGKDTVKDSIYETGFKKNYLVQERMTDLYLHYGVMLTQEVADLILITDTTKKKRKKQVG